MSRSSRAVWRTSPRELLSLWTMEIIEHAALWYDALAPDGVVAIEVDDYRDRESGALIPLPDLVREALIGVGFSLQEHIRLARPAAYGHRSRSGHFKRYGGRAGYFLPDNVCSTLIIAFKGNPLARLRAEATDSDRADLAWSERFLRNLWTLRPAARREVALSHPVSQDPDVARAIVMHYTRAGDMVIDPYSGSGTTAREALRLSRDAIAVEREPHYAAMTRAAVTPYGRVLDIAHLAGAVPRKRVVIPSAQLWLPIGAAATAQARTAFLRNSTAGEVTDRIKKMAAAASAASAVQIPPELVGFILRAERELYYAGRNVKRRQAA
ncbi:MAG: DNA methyltransferase [Gemmatimonadaceae bacterium]